MTTRKRRQQQRLKAFGLILKRHRCGQSIFAGEDGQYFAAEERPGMDPTPGKEPITACPRCHREFVAKDITGDGA